MAVCDARYLIDRAVVARFHLVRILDHLVDEITEVQNEIELLGGASAFIFVDHPAKGVELALVDVLTAHECEVHGAGIVRQRRGDGAADPAAISVAVRESIPVSARRLQSADQNARGPVRGARDRRLRVRDDSAECLILGYFDGQDVACSLGERTSGPEDDAVRVGIAGGDPLRIEITPLTPVDTRTAGRSNPCQRSTDCCGSFEKRSAADLHVSPRRLQTFDACENVTPQLRIGWRLWIVTRMSPGVCLEALATRQRGSR